MAGVTRSTLARWKKEDEEVELLLDQARTQYQAPRLARIDETRMKDGQRDWRAQAWLVKFANPEVYGAPSRRRKLRDVELEPELTLEEQRAKEEAEGHAAMQQALKDWEEFHQSSKAFFASGKKITPEMLAWLQQRRAIWLRDEAGHEPDEAGASAEADAPPESGGGMMPAMLAELRERRRIARLEDEPAAAQGSAPSEAGAPPDSGAGPAKSVTFRPDIRALYREPGEGARPAAARAPTPSGLRTTAAMAG
jgi:hypothetical protein